MLKVLLFLFAIVSMHGESFATCDKWLANYNKHLYMYVNGSNMKNKKISAYMTKSYQDDLLSKCNGTINISRVTENKRSVDMAYELFYK
jgi:hypothetical protein